MNQAPARANNPYIRALCTLFTIIKRAFGVALGLLLIDPEFNMKTSVKNGAPLQIRLTSIDTTIRQLETATKSLRSEFDELQEHHRSPSLMNHPHILTLLNYLRRAVR
jgi:hypothetical protein